MHPDNQEALDLCSLSTVTTGRCSSLKPSVGSIMGKISSKLTNEVMKDIEGTSRVASKLTCF